MSDLPEPTIARSAEGIRARPGRPRRGRGRRRGRAGRRRTPSASPIAVTASAVACASAWTASGATTVTASGPDPAGAPVAGSIRWWSDRSGPKRRLSRPEVATPPASSSSTPRVSPGVRGSATASRQGPPSGVEPHERDVAAEVDEPAGQRWPRGPHRLERAHGGEALADPAEVDGRAVLDPGATAVGSSSISAPARQSAARAGRTLVELLERAVVAGGDERGQDRRVEPCRPSPRVRGVPAAAPRTVARRRRPTRRAASFRRERSLSGSKRERARSQAAISARAAARADPARRRVERAGRHRDAPQSVPIAGKVSRCRRAAFMPPPGVRVEVRAFPAAGPGVSRRTSRLRRSARVRGIRIRAKVSQSTGPAASVGDEQPHSAAHVGADRQRVAEPEREAGEARVVEQRASTAVRSAGGTGTRARA